MKKHYHLMNGSSGCLPDNNEIHTSFKNAYESAKQLFDDMNRQEKRELKNFGFTYLRQGMGADYIEISDCYEKDCKDDTD